MTQEREEHWNRAYGRGETSLSWHQEVARRSLDLLLRLAPERRAPIVDVGGGSSRLVDGLLDEGYTDLTVLDVSQTALDLVRSRLDAGATGVRLIAADITEWKPKRAYRLWHDRAVFHFMVEPAAQQAYLEALRDGTESGSTVVISTFAPDGPERCSGLPVQRYSAQSLADRLGGDFRLLEASSHIHVTPAGREQSFQTAVFERLG